MQKLVLRNFQSPGDIVMLTAAVRDLHRSYAGAFLTDIRTSAPELWLNNPYVTGLDEQDHEVRIIDCHYPLIHQSNQRPFHFIHGFIQYLNEILSLHIEPTAFKGDIHLSSQERTQPSMVQELHDDNRPVWLVAAGGKRDFTIKWWDSRRYQEVIDHFRGKLQFVQVGQEGHFHPALEGVIDLRAKTSLRELILLVHHSSGVLTPVSLLMHLAAAVENRTGVGSDSFRPAATPCVVIAGGREPVHWEAYPTHQFIHTIGMLHCCRDGGCWRSRTLPLADQDEKNLPQNLCVDVVGKLPRCMDMITSSEVIRRIEMYLEGARADQPNQPDLSAEPIMPTEVLGNALPDKLTLQNANLKSEEYITTIPSYPLGAYEGRGIVICGGGVKYFTCAWVCIQMLRKHSCTLPIELWYLGQQEMDAKMQSLIAPLNVKCVDALKVREKHPTRILNGWELKVFALLNSSFRDVLLLDADNTPVRNPEYLFETGAYGKTGAIFWPDYGICRPRPRAWTVFGVPYKEERDFETGQVVLNKERCWKALSLCMWYNANSDFYYHYVLGDKDTFYFAFRKVGQGFAMPDAPIFRLDSTMCQHDLDGNRVFQHRSTDKWNFRSGNKKVEGFLFERECVSYLDELRTKWNGVIEPVMRSNLDSKTNAEKAIIKAFIDQSFDYYYGAEKARPMSFLAGGVIGVGAAAGEIFWDIRIHDQQVSLELYAEDRLMSRLKQEEDGIWSGSPIGSDQTRIELRPVKKS